MAHHVILPIFEGPLDLLLFLISRAQIDIKEIFISNITEQYLEYTSQITIDNMESKSAFLIMAARLLEIKSHKLLPESIYEEENEEDIKKKLIKQLQEYKIYKLACEKLIENEKEAKLRYYRMPEEILERSELNLEGIDIDILSKAFAEISRKINDTIDNMPIREIERETFSVHEKIFFIRKILLNNKNTSFKELFKDSASKSEVIVTFMALLELSRMGRITLTQNLDDDGIYIKSIDTPMEDNNE